MKAIAVEPGRDSLPQLHEVQRVVVHSPCLLPKAGSNIGGFGALHRTCLEGSQCVVCLPQVDWHSTDSETVCSAHIIHIVEALGICHFSTASSWHMPLPNVLVPTRQGHPVAMVWDAKIDSDVTWRHAFWHLKPDPCFRLKLSAVAFLHFCAQFMIWANVWTSATLFSCRMPLCTSRWSSGSPQISSSKFEPCPRPAGLVFLLQGYWQRSSN